MAKLELAKCDSCGCIKGQRERESDWCTVYVPTTGPSINIPEDFSSWLEKARHYCPLCWRDVVKPLLPSSLDINTPYRKALGKKLIK